MSVTQIHNVDLVTAQDAGRLFEYTPDYIAKLAREGKIEASRIGRQWMVSPRSIEAFRRKAKKKKSERSKRLREERLEEQQTYQNSSIVSRKSLSSCTLPSRYELLHTNHIALTQTLAILIVGLVFGISSYTVVTDVRIAQQASVIDAAFDSMEHMARALFDLISPKTEERVVLTEAVSDSNSDSNEAIPFQRETVSTTTYPSLIVAPSETFTDTQIAEIRDSFSDEVEVSFDPLNPDSGIIVPIFKERRGGEYRFLLAPINPGKSTGS